MNQNGKTYNINVKNENTMKSKIGCIG